MPVFEPKIKLRNEQNAYRYNYQQNYDGYNLCPECDEEEAGDEKVTRTVKVLLPENEYAY